ncbi:MAG: hypothetical protein M3268_09440 [Acidobacteriota bacterium]|nr:hypothetical protein [Acidobacteriota bacterium]
MDTKLILAFAAVGLVCFVVGLLVGRAGRRDGQMMVRPNIASPSGSFGATPPASLGTTTPSVSFDASAAAGEVIDERLRELLRENKLIEAIKLYRERTGCGLKEAKEAVEEERSRTHAAGRVEVRSSFGDGAVTHEHVSVKFGGELLEMLSSGRREEVLRLVRERSGIGEAEAEAVVAKLETLMGRFKQ